MLKGGVGLLSGASVKTARDHGFANCAEICLHRETETQFSLKTLDGSFVLIGYNAPFGLKKALWARFSSEAANSFVILQNNGGVMVQTPNFDYIDLCVPCRIGAIFKTDFGLLLARDMQNVPPSESPSFFTLSHPLTDVKPVPFSSICDKDDAWASKLLLLDVQSGGLVTAFHKEEGLLLLCRLVHCEKEEILEQTLLDKTFNASLFPWKQGSAIDQSSLGCLRDLDSTVLGEIGSEYELQIIWKFSELNRDLFGLALTVSVRTDDTGTWALLYNPDSQAGCLLELVGDWKEEIVDQKLVWSATGSLSLAMLENPVGRCPLGICVRSGGTVELLTERSSIPVTTSLSGPGDQQVVAVSDSDSHRVTAACKGGASYRCDVCFWPDSALLRQCLSGLTCCMDVDSVLQLSCSVTRSALKEWSVFFRALLQPSSGLPAEIFRVLLLIFQESRLVGSSVEDARQIGSFLHALADLANLPDVMDAISRQLGGDAPLMELTFSDNGTQEEWKEGLKVYSSCLDLPDVYLHIFDLLSDGPSIPEFPSTPCCPRMEALLRVFRTIAMLLRPPSSDASLIELQLLQNLRSTPAWPKIFFSLSPGLAMIILIVLESISDSIGRPVAADALALLKQCYCVPQVQCVADRSTPQGDNAALEGDLEGLIAVQALCGLRFPLDRRLEEVHKLLSAESPQLLVMSAANITALTEHEIVKRQQEILSLMALRTCAFAVGRGMVTMAMMSPRLAEPLSVGNLCLSGRLADTDAEIQWRVMEEDFESMQQWPMFQTGVASALKLLPASETVAAATRSWIMSNKPKSPKPHHGGFLFGLGLLGHLKELENTDVFAYFRDRDVHTSVGLLLGMAVNGKGSQDVAVAKMLSLHLPAMLPAGLGETGFTVPVTVQIAALAGLGFLYEGSCHRLLNEFLLQQIVVRPSLESPKVESLDFFASDGPQQIGSFAMSAGIALGLINLGTGGRKSAGQAGLADLALGDRLHGCMQGGRLATFLNSFNDSTQQSSARHHVQHPRSEFDLMFGGIRDAKGTEEVSHLNLDDASQACCIVEGELIDVHITAPAALVALGLMYIDSNDPLTCARLELPNSFEELIGCRCELLMLRVVTYWLVRTDGITPSEDWLTGCMPESLEMSYQRLFESPTSRRSSPPSMFAEPQVCCSNADHLGFEGEWEGTVDIEAVSQCHAWIRAGLCLALGIKYAGTGDDVCRALLLAEFRKLLKWRRTDRGDVPDSRPPLLEDSSVECCASVVAVACGMVLAGTGDLELLRLLRIAQGLLLKQVVAYGHYLFYFMALGFLFLRGGKSTLHNSVQSRAYLFIATLPRFAAVMCEQPNYLEPLRHVYVLAVDHRCLSCVDAQTGKETAVTATVSYQPKESPTPQVVSVQSPGLLPPASELLTIQIRDDKFWPVFHRCEQVSRFAEPLVIPLQSLSTHSFSGDVCGGKWAVHSHNVRLLTKSLSQSMTASPFGLVIDAQAFLAVEAFLHRWLSSPSPDGGSPPLLHDVVEYGRVLDGMLQDCGSEIRSALRSATWGKWRSPAKAALWLVRQQFPLLSTALHVMQSIPTVGPLGSGVPECLQSVQQLSSAAKSPFTETRVPIKRRSAGLFRLAKLVRTGAGHEEEEET